MNLSVVMAVLSGLWLGLAGIWPPTTVMSPVGSLDAPRDACQVEAGRALSGASPAEAGIGEARTYWPRVVWGEPLNIYTNAITTTFSFPDGLAANSFYQLALGCGATTPASLEVVTTPWSEGRCWTTPAGFFCLAEADTASSLVVTAHYAFSGAPCAGQGEVSYRQQWRLCAAAGACATGFYVGELGPVNGPTPTPEPPLPTPSPAPYPGLTPAPYPSLEPLSAEWLQFGGQAGALTPAMGWWWLALIVVFLGWQQKRRFSSVDLANIGRFLYNVRHCWNGRNGDNHDATG